MQNIPTIDIHVISALSILLPVVFGIYAFRYFTKELKGLFWLCCLGLAFNVFSYFVQARVPSNLLYVSNYTWYGLEFIILMKILSMWSKHKIYIQIGFVFLPIHIGYSILNGFSEFHVATKIISSMIIVFSVFSLFKKTLVSEDRPMSVIFVGLGLYFSVSTIAYFTYSRVSQDVGREIWTIHTVMNILMNISIFVGFYMRKAFVKRSINSDNVSSGYLPDSTTFN